MPGLPRGAKNLVGPQLNGIIGRKTGSAEDYNYTEANKNANITWDVKTSENTSSIPRARSRHQDGFAGIKNPQQVTDLIAYLTQFDASGKKTQ